MPTFWRMNDMAIAVISGASRGAEPQRPVGDALDARVEQPAEDHRDRERPEQRRPRACLAPVAGAEPEHAAA